MAKPQIVPIVLRLEGDGVLALQAVMVDGMHCCHPMALRVLDALGRALVPMGSAVKLHYDVLAGGDPPAIDDITIQLGDLAPPTMIERFIANIVASPPGGKPLDPDRIASLWEGAAGDETGEYLRGYLWTYCGNLGMTDGEIEAYVQSVDPEAVSEDKDAEGAEAVPDESPGYEPTIVDDGETSMPPERVFLDSYPPITD